jgi:hypothetical protein
MLLPPRASSDTYIPTRHKKKKKNRPETSKTIKEIHLALPIPIPDSTDCEIRIMARRIADEQ